MDDELHLAPEVLTYYEQGNEAERLTGGRGLLEFARTKELIKRYITPPPAVILDIGGATGIHALWLARGGYEVHLRDPVLRLVDVAQALSAQQRDYPIASCRVGDARRMEVADESVDAVLMLGPLYHLVAHADRIKSLREAFRVLRAGGTLLAVGISRYASALDGMARGYIKDPEFNRIVDQDLTDGQHRNPTNELSYFTTAFFHRPDELKAEAEQAGFNHEVTLPIEGPAWLMQDFDEQWNDPERRKRLLDLVRSLETAPSLLGASAHLMVVARKGRAGG